MPQRFDTRQHRVVPALSVRIDADLEPCQSGELSLTQSLAKCVILSARPNDRRDSRADHVGCLAANQVDHLVVELDAQDLAACRIGDCVLVARAQVVVATDHGELWQELKRQEVLVPLAEDLSYGFLDALLYLKVRWIIGVGEETPFEVNGAVNFGHCDCSDLLIAKPPDVPGPPLGRLEDVAQLLDGARSQLRALRGEGEPHDGLLPSGVDEDVLDPYVLRPALDCILEGWLALRDQLLPDDAEIDLEAVAECGCDGAVCIDRPRLGRGVLCQLAQVGELCCHSLIQEQCLQLSVVTSFYI